MCIIRIELRYKKVLYREVKCSRRSFLLIFVLGTTNGRPSVDEVLVDRGGEEYFVVSWWKERKIIRSTYRDAREQRKQQQKAQKSLRGRCTRKEYIFGHLCPDTRRSPAVSVRGPPLVLQTFVRGNPMHVLVQLRSRWSSSNASCRLVNRLFDVLSGHCIKKKKKKTPNNVDESATTLILWVISTQIHRKEEGKEKKIDLRTSGQCSNNLLLVAFMMHRK